MVDEPVPGPETPRFAGRLALARAALLWELVWPPLFPAVLVAGIFLALALFDVPALLPGWARVALLITSGIALLAALVVAGREFRWPSRAQARRRLELASRLEHRPLQALEDRPAASGDVSATALWQAHRARMAGAVRRLSLVRPRGGIGRRDPYALRIALALALVAGAVTAGPDIPARLARAFHPGVSLFGPPAGVALDIWVTPPQYTGLPPQFLAVPGDGSPVVVPAGSQVLAQVHGGYFTPRLMIDRNPTPMSPVDAANYKGAATIAAGTQLSVVQGWSTLGSWPIKVVPDNPPTISFARPPQRTPRGALRLEYAAADDYGVEKVTALVRRADGPPGETLAVDLSLPDQHLKRAEGTSYNDLTAHPWAGLKVRIQLQAEDALGQTGDSEIVETVLPEREFHNPIARAIIDQRKELTRDPGDREPVAETLADLSIRPALFNNDAVVFLALRTAADRLMLDRDDDTVPAVQELLWNTAVRVEDGRAAQSQEDLRTSMRALQEALARNAPEAEIERLMQALQQQIDRYLEALAQRPPQAGQAAPPSDPSRNLSSEDLKRFLDRARELARAGARDQARDLLAQMQELLENLRSASPMDMKSPAGRSLNAMQDLMRRQQQLLDRSFRRSREPNAPPAPGDAAEQDKLRRALAEMMRQLGQQGGQIPQSMDRAGRAMQGAVDALKNGQPGQAIGPQTEALDALQQSAREFADKMMQGYDASAFGDAGMPQAARRDPFGRLTPDDHGTGGFDENGQLRMGKSSEDYAIQRARAILDELRRRAGEAERPALERDYIDRLLKEF